MKSSTVAIIARTRHAQVVTAAAPFRLLLAVNKILRGRVSMSDDDEQAPVPFMQKLLDNPFLLLFLGACLNKKAVFLHSGLLGYVSVSCLLFFLYTVDVVRHNPYTSTQTMLMLLNCFFF